MRSLFLLLAFIIIIAGCISTNNTTAPPQAPPAQPPFAVEQEIPVKIDTLNYSKFHTSFSYPNTMNWEERLNNYQNGTGYAYIKFSDEESAILLGYLYVGNVSELKTADPYQVAAVNLESESNAEQDPVGILHSATELGPLSSGKVDIGYAAIRKFTVIEKDSVDNLYGVAIDIYVPDSSILYDFRIFSTNEKLVKPIADAFLNSLKFYPANFTQQIDIAQNVSVQNLTTNVSSQNISSSNISNISNSSS